MEASNEKNPYHGINAHDNPDYFRLQQEKILACGACAGKCARSVPGNGNISRILA
jgi:hypothetical protein